MGNVTALALNHVMRFHRDMGSGEEQEQPEGYEKLEGYEADQDRRKVKRENGHRQRNHVADVKKLPSDKLDPAKGWMFEVGHAPEAFHLHDFEVFEEDPMQCED